MVKVLIVEDQRIVRNYMINYIEKSNRYSLAGAINNAAMTEMFCLSHAVDLILMDVCTEHSECGLKATAAMKRHFPEIKVIIITSMVECGYLDFAREAGAESFWYKDTGKEELINVMDRTMKGERVYPSHTPEVRIGLTTNRKFTNSELKVLRPLVEGYSYEEIGEKLGIKGTTVRYHVNNMRQKTGYKNKLRLAIAVANSKLIIPGDDGEFYDE